MKWIYMLCLIICVVMMFSVAFLGLWNTAHMAVTQMNAADYILMIVCFYIIGSGFKILVDRE